MSCVLYYDNFDDFIRLNYRYYFKMHGLGITRANLESLCQERGVEFAKQDNRDKLFDKLIENGMTPTDFYELFKDQFGANYSDYTKKFNLTRNQLTKLKESDFFVAVNHYKIKMYGKEVEAPLLCCEQFFSTTKKDIDKILGRD